MEWKEEDEDYRSSQYEEEAMTTTTQKCIMVGNRRVTIFPRYRRKRPSPPGKQHRRRGEKAMAGDDEEERRAFGGCRHSSWKTRCSRRVDCLQSTDHDGCARKVASAKTKEMDPLLEYDESDNDVVTRCSQPCLNNSDDDRSLSRAKLLQKSQTVARSTSAQEARHFKQRSVRNIGTWGSQPIASSSATNRSHERTYRFITNSNSSGVDSAHADPFFQSACSRSKLLATEAGADSHHSTWNQSAFVRVTRILRFLRLMRPNNRESDAIIHRNVNSEIHPSTEEEFIIHPYPDPTASSLSATDRTESDDGGSYQQQQLIVGRERNRLDEGKYEGTLRGCHQGPSDCQRSPIGGASVSSGINRPATEEASKLRSLYGSPHHPRPIHRGLHHDVAAAYFLGRSQVPQSASQQLLRYGKTFLAFLFSTIGLTFLLVGYTIIGGFLFRALEAPNETQVRSDMHLVRLDYIERLWALTETLNVLHPVNWSEMAESLLVNYTTEVFLATKKLGWDGKDLGETERQWSFAGSLLYSITVITTIGYGHITPKTDWGRVVTMMYAIVGIPLTLLTMAQLGGFMAKTFRFIYKNICCGLCCICCSSKRQKSKITFKMADGDEKIESADEETTSSTNQLLVNWVVRIRRLLDLAFDDVDNVRVPASVSLLLIVSYIAIGAVMFNEWEEGEWGFLVGCYFCFITLSTIGFGDYVPGTSLDSWAAQEKLIICALYLLFGLALIAMCFNLMQEEARRNIRALGRKLGLIVKDEEIR